MIYFFAGVVVGAALWWAYEYWHVKPRLIAELAITQQRVREYEARLFGRAL